jgi:putative pyruvate formate lyase activating enzyme
VVASGRSVEARRALLNCQLCAHRCGVNRLAGEQGQCHAGPSAQVFSAQLEVADELELIPTFAIAFSGCDLRCAFCITGAQSWNARAGEPFDAIQLAMKVERALVRGARSVMILGGEPTIYLPSVIELVSALPDEARLVWKTNAHGSAEARALLDGLFDVWLADYKFGNDECAQRLARVPNYTAVVRENLLWASAHSELIVRHLLMPGHVECCWRPIAAWLASEMPGVKIGLRDGFWPGWQTMRHTELHRTVSADEAQDATRVAQEFELKLVK